MSEFDAMLAAGRRPKLDRPAAIAAAIGNVAEPEGHPHAPLASAGAMASTLGCDVGAIAASSCACRAAAASGDEVPAMVADIASEFQAADGIT